MGLIDNIVTVIKNTTFNSLGVDRSLEELLQSKDVSRAKSLLQNRDDEVLEAIAEYDPEQHKVMMRRDKLRKKKEPYIVEKLPRRWQVVINEIALFFMLGNPIKWSRTNAEEGNEAFPAFEQFMKDTRFNTTMRQAKRLAGSETESAKLYHIYRNEETFQPEVKVVVLSKSKGYTLRPLFDQYGSMLAFGYGYFLRENGNTVEHFDIQTPGNLYFCRKASVGWEVDVRPNPTGKINVIYYQQEKEWEGVQHRIERDEMVDSKSADTNNYFADPIAAASADVINAMADPETVGKLIQLQGPDSVFRYVEPPSSIEMKESEKKDLRDSILQDSFTPDFSYANMKGMGTLSGEALRRALILGYIKRDNRLEIYDLAVDREKNLILAIMKNVTHIHLRSEIEKLEIEFQFSEPFNEDEQSRWTEIGRAYSDGIISLETAVKLLSIAGDPTEEIERIKAEKQADYEGRRSVDLFEGGV